MKKIKNSQPQTNFISSYKKRSVTWNYNTNYSSSMLLIEKIPCVVMNLEISREK